MPVSEKFQICTIERLSSNRPSSVVLGELVHTHHSVMAAFLTLHPQFSLNLVRRLAGALDP